MCNILGGYFQCWPTLLRRISYWRYTCIDSCPLRGSVSIGHNLIWIVIICIYLVFIYFYIIDFSMNSWDVARLTANLGDYNIKSKSDVKHLERKIKRVVRHRGFDQRTLVSVTLLFLFRNTDSSELYRQTTAVRVKLVF